MLKARLDLPLPLSPVITTSSLRGSSTLMSFRLFSFAPITVRNRSEWGSSFFLDLRFLGAAAGAVKVEGAVDLARAIVSFSPVDGPSVGVDFATVAKVIRLFIFCVEISISL